LSVQKKSIQRVPDIITMQVTFTGIQQSSYPSCLAIVTRLKLDFSQTPLQHSLSQRPLRITHTHKAEYVAKQNSDIQVKDKL
jgi:phenylalanine-4-hydroxylase